MDLSPLYVNWNFERMSKGKLLIGLLHRAVPVQKLIKRSKERHSKTSVRAHFKHCIYVFLYILVYPEYI